MGLDIDDDNDELVPMCKIVGADKMGGFKLEIPESLIVEKCQDIWDHPENYHQFEDSFYDFLKFLWVEYPDGTDKRLTDLVTMSKH